jgi:UDP-N-acetylmuramyl pentapeptide phosphotransferase/UDP-N-acetylglucosamine-1-phosphate transferase
VELFLIGACVVVLAYWLTGYLCSPASRVYLLDHPNERSLHVAPKPRTGGLAVVGALVAGLLLLLPIGKISWPSFWIIGAALLIGAVSFWDDRADLPVGLRFVIHSIAAIGTVWALGFTITQVPLPFAGVASLGWFGALLAVMFLIWMTNLYNFMDGMDGFAGGMTVIGFGFLGLLAWKAGAVDVAILSFLVIAATVGFLVYNIPPARIFLGDVGSAVLGFLAAALALRGIQHQIFDIWVPILIFSPFIVDATVTLLRRLVRGEKIWRPHREHYYQRLVLSGWSHRKTVTAEYVLMVASGVSAVAYTYASQQTRWFILIGWILLYIILALGVSSVEKRQERLVRSGL